MDYEALVKHFLDEAEAALKRLTENAYTGDSASAERKADTEAMEKALKTAEDYKAKIVEAKSLEAELKANAERMAKIKDMPTESKGDDKNPETKSGNTGLPVPSTKSETPTPLTPGETFTKSAAYVEAQEKGFTDHHYNGGLAAKVEFKALITSPSLPSTNRYENYAPKPLKLMDAISVVDLGAESITVHRLIYSANNAAVVAEGVSSPESAFVWQSVTLTPEDIAHWTPVSNNTLKDHGTVEGIINIELAWGVHTVMETNIIADVTATTGILTEAFDTDILTTLLNAKTTAEAVRTPTGILMNPTDVNTLLLLKGTDGHYVGPGPFGYTNLIIWGLPVYSVPAMDVGFAFVGNLESIYWRNREATTIQTGWRNTDFTDRQSTIQAVARGLTDVSLPGAMVLADIAA